MINTAIHNNDNDMLLMARTILRWHIGISDIKSNIKSIYQLIIGLVVIF